MKFLSTPFHLRTHNFLPAILMALSLIVVAEEAPAPAANPEGKPSLEEAVKKLNLPGVEINLKERCVDVASTVCLEEGVLELIACAKDTKEHEAIVRIEAIPKHVHTALLLMGATPGSPAMSKLVDEEETRWIDVPPSGGPVDVLLVFPDKDGKLVERPISDFIIAADQGSGETVANARKERFPTHTFLFAGSVLQGEKDGPRQYLADSSGNVISLVTFGDEMLCMSGFHDDANGQLMWQIDSEHLPPIGTTVTLRLRPQVHPKLAPEGEKPPAKVTE
jgi:hypothetical protein